MDEAAAIAEVDEALAKLTRLYGKPGDARIRAKLAAARAAFRATEGDPLL